MSYAVDASSLMEAKNRYYSFETCPGFWDWLDAQRSAGTVLSIDQIYNELVKGEGDLATWAKARARTFFKPLDRDPATLAAYARVVA